MNDKLLGAIRKLKTIEHIGKYKGYTYFVVFRGVRCFRCGYVLVNRRLKEENEKQIKCHGGLSGNGCADVICHALKNKLCIGFDCEHAGDGYDYETCRELYGEEVADCIEERESYGGRNTDEVVRDKDYCIDNCKEIIDQLYKKFGCELVEDVFER